MLTLTIAGPAGGGRDPLRAAGRALEVVDGLIDRELRRASDGVGMRVRDIAAGRAGDKGAVLDLTLVARRRRRLRAARARSVTAERAERGARPRSGRTATRSRAARAQVRRARGARRWAIRDAACGYALAEGRDPRPAGHRADETKEAADVATE